MKARTLGVEEIEKQEKEEQKKKAIEKKSSESPQTEEKAEGAEKPVKNEKRTEKKKGQPGPGKKHIAAKKKVDATKKYPVDAAIALIKKMKYVKFDESVDLHLNVDENGLKGEVELPHATGKTVRVAILDDKILGQLEAGKIEFDILITHPSFMPKLAKYAKILGPKGLMPNPKAGTISPKPEEVAKKFEKGMLRFKTEGKFPLIHQMVGKTSYDDKKLIDNVKVFIIAVGKIHIKEAYLTATMTPSVRLDIETI